MSSSDLPPERRRSLLLLLPLLALLGLVATLPACEDAGARPADLTLLYTGNVHDRAGQSTYCASCGELVIGRA